MILKIEETEKGLFVTKEDDNGAANYPVETKYELVYVVIELIQKWLSTEKIDTLMEDDAD